jgi:hypothetical protein
MGNEFLSIKNIARQALPRLIENLVFPNLIYKDYSETYEVGKGATIQVRKPVVLTASDFDSSLGTSAQDVKEKSVEVTLDKLATVDVEFGAIARATSVDDLNRLFIEPAAVALAEKINSDGLALYKDIPYYTGTAGSTPTTLAIFANAAKVLDDNKVPTTMRRGVWNPTCMAAFRQIGDIVNAEKSGATEALRAGSIGNIFGIENYMAQGVKSVTSGNPTAGGTGASGVKVKTAVTDDDDIVLVSNATASATLTGKVNAGDILVIGGKNYIVQTTAEASSNEISVALDRNITVAANAAVTVISGGGQNLVFHQNAFAFVTRPLAAPAGVESYTTSYNGVTLRVVRGYDMQYKKEMLSMDVLYGYKTMYPELAVRALS